MMPLMQEPTYAPHERIRLRKQSVPARSPDAVTVSLYEQLIQHILGTYPDSGPLRSMALRKLTESANDILDHGALIAEASQPAPQVVSSVVPPLEEAPEPAMASEGSD